MKVTLELVKWLQAEYKKHDFSYSELARQCANKLSWSGWRKLLTHATAETTAATDEAICEVFNITPDELRRIAEGGKATPRPEQGYARALWNWVAADPRRAGAIEAMGYRGVLPADEQKRGKSKK